MNRNDVGHLLAEAMRITKHRDYVIIGSLSVLGAPATPPDSMTGSIDVDLYPRTTLVARLKLPPHWVWVANSNSATATTPMPYRPCCRPYRMVGNIGSSK